MFSPEFRNRLDARIPFATLSPKTMDSIVEKFIIELEAQLLERDVTMMVTTAAKKYLAEKGYDPDFGARPLARVIQEDIKRPLGDELLFGKLENGDRVPPIDTLVRPADSAVRNDADQPETTNGSSLRVA